MSQCKLCNDTGEAAKDILCSCPAGQRLMEGEGPDNTPAIAEEQTKIEVEPYTDQTPVQRAINKGFDKFDRFLDFWDTTLEDEDDDGY